MIRDTDYYIKVGKFNPELKEVILNDINDKFGINDISLLQNIDFSNKDNAYIIYSIINKNFEFLLPFSTLKAESFKNSEEKYEYFGITNISSDKLNKNVNVLFYDNIDEFAVSLKTREAEEIILYRTNGNGTFESLYNEVNEKGKKYTGNTNFQDEDELKIPIINMNMSIRYDELCNKFIKNTNGMYIANAIQNINFNLDRFGGNIKSESYVEETYFSDIDKERLFYFTDKFILFIKEKDIEMPYMSLIIDNNEILKKYEGD